MLNVSNAFNEAFKSPTRQVLVRITMKNIVYTNNDIFNVEYTSGSITGETFNIGSVFSNSIKITFTKVIEAVKQLDFIKLEFGIVLADGSREFVSMGYFFVDKYNPDRNANRTVIEALDQMTQLERVYKSELTYPARIKDVALEIANLAGSVVDQASFERLPTTAIVKFEGKTYRQAIGLIAQFAGGFSIFDRDGKLSIRTLSDPNFSISTAEYFSRGLVKNETMYTLGGISCKVSTKNGDATTDFMLQSGEPLGNQIALENSSMTQILLDSIYQQLKNTNYYPYTLSWRGNPALEAGDWISMSDTKANSFKMPNLTYKLSFSGGLKATSSADTSSVSQASASYRGPINQQLIELQGWKSAAGGWTYTGTTEPSTPKEGDVWFKPNGPDTETLIYEGGKWVFQTSTAGIRQVTEEMNQAQKDIVEAKKAADDAVDKANQNIKEIGELDVRLIDTKILTDKALADVNKVASENKILVDKAQVDATKAIDDAKTAYDKATENSGKIVTANQEIDKVKGSITTKVEKIDFDKSLGRITQAESSITQNANAITQKVSSTDVENILTGKAYATKSEVVQTSNSLTSTITGVRTDVDGLGANTAYAYSADGVDRFTTVYPNLNLLTNSRLQTNNIYPWVANFSTLSVRKNGLSISSSQVPKNSDTGAVQYDFPFVGGKSYTISCYVLNNSETPITSFKLQFRFESPTGSTYPSKIFGNSVSNGVWTKLEFTAIAPQNATKASAYFLVRSIADNSSFNFDITDMKVEQGSTATLWMPSQNEVKPIDYPPYVGRSLKYSTNYSDYKWEIDSGYTDAKADNQQTQVTQLTQNLDGFKTTVSSTYLNKTDASNLYPTKTTVATQISQSATDITNSVQSWTNGRLTDYSTIQQTNNSITSAVSGKADRSQVTQLSDSLTSTIAGVRTDLDALGTNLAYAYSADGTDRFSTVYPNLNLLDGTRDFSGTWIFSDSSVNDGTYKGLVVKKKTGQWNGINKSLTIQTSNSYTFSAFVKGAGIGTTFSRFVYINGVETKSFGRIWTSPFDWTRDSVTLSPINIKQGDVVTVRYDISVLGTNQAIWTAGHKWESGSTATTYMPSSSEVKPSDYPSYIGRALKYSTNPSDYKWEIDSGYTDAKTVVQQTQISQMSQDLNGFKTTVSSTYLSSTDASNTYPTKGAVSGTYLNKTDASNTYPTKDAVANTYPTKTTVTSQINQSATDITSSVQSWTNDKLTGYSTTQQTNNSITNAVADKADKSQVTQLSNQITSAVTQINSENLNFVLDGSFQTGDNWSTTSTTSTNYTLNNSKGIPISAGSYLRVLDTKDEYFVTQSASTQVINSLKNSTVTFSMYVKCASGSSDTFRIYIRTKADDGTLTYLGRTNQTVTTSWKRLSITVEIPADVTELIFTANVRGLPNVYSYITGAQATVGNVLLPYAESTLNLASKSQITQLSDMINLRVSKGDVTSQINIEAGRTLIDTKQLLLNANTVKFSGSAFIPDAMIQNLTASKINTGTLNAANVNIINLNASNITGGTLNAIDIKGSNITSVGENYTLNQKNGSITWNRNSDGKKVFGIETQVEPSNEGNTVFEVSKKGSLSIFSKTEDVNIYKNLLTFYNNADNGITASSSVDKIFVQGTDNSASRNQTYSLTISESGISYTSSKSTRPTFNFSNFDSAISFLVGDDISSISLIGGVARVKSKYTTISGDFTVTGSKNAIHATRDGVRATPAYETAESYLGDIGQNYTRKNCEVWIDIDKLFSDTVNTDIAYQVFLQAYDDAKFWVADFKSDKFLIKSDKPLSRFVWEIKAKRRGYESDRLVLQDDFDSEKIEEAWREK